MPTIKRWFAPAMLALALAIAGCASRAPQPAVKTQPAASFVAAAVTTTISATQTPDKTVKTQGAKTATTEPTVSVDSKAEESDSNSVARPAGWSEDSHGSDAAPNYDVVFPQDKVNQIRITISPENWEAMQANMTELLGEAGTGGGPGGWHGGNAQPPAGQNGQPPQPPAGQDGQQPPAQDGQPPMGRGGDGFGGGGRNMDMTPVNPSWFPATIQFNGQTWDNVGVRYKGNSSLTSGWRSGSDKLPLKLDFDEFEDDYPEIENQRFYGFKQLALGNNFSDSTGIRETLAYDLLGQAGLVASKTAFYEVILDHGDGEVSLGVYTMVEVVDDTVIQQAFGDDSGNIYEGDGAAASLAEGTANAIETSFQKENNEEAADWSDVQALYDALHSDARTTAPEQWRAALESVFDVDAFLKWLAMNAIMKDWDQYGSMSHNYYLYHDLETDKLVWISWDHNMAFGSGPGRGRGGGATSLDQASVNENWPLIRFLLDDEVYAQKYRAYLSESLAVFDADAIASKIDALTRLLQPYMEKSGQADGFTTAVSQLKTFVEAQEKAAQTFLAQ